MHVGDLVIKENVRDMENIEKSPDFAEFVLSIATGGVYEPVTYYVDKDTGENVVLHGHRRLLAARVAGLQDIPVHRTKRPDDQSRIIQQLVTGVQRKNLNHMDVARGIASLINTHGMTQQYIAEMFGLSPAWVSQHLGLLDLIEPLKEKVQAGELAYRAGYEAKGFTDEDWKKFGSSINAAKTVRDVKQVKRGIAYAKAHDTPQQVVDTKPETTEKQVEVAPDESLLRCLALIAMATDSIKAAKSLAQDNDLNIADALASHVKEIEK